MANEPEEATSAARPVELPEQGILVLQEYALGAELEKTRREFLKSMVKVYKGRGPGLGEAGYRGHSVAEDARLMQQISEDTTHPAVLVTFITSDLGRHSDIEAQLIRLMNGNGLTVWKLWPKTATAARGEVYPPPEEGEPYPVTIALTLPPGTTGT